MGVRQFVVSRAPAPRVARHVREAVEDVGGIVAHHTSRKTEFDHLDHGEGTWRRAGYVGTYQRFKEKPVQVRVRVWAQWPRRLLIGSVYLGFAEAVVLFALSVLGAAIPPNLWIGLAVPTLAAIAISLLLYTSSIPDSEDAEERIEAEVAERVAEDEEIPGRIFDVDAWDDYRTRQIEEAREAARERAPHGGSRVRRAVSSAQAALAGSAGAEAETVEEGETEPAAAGEEAPDDGDGDGEAESLADKLPLLGGDPDQDDEPDDGEDGSGLRDKLPFLGNDAPEDDEGNETEPPDGDEGS